MLFGDFIIQQLAAHKPFRFSHFSIGRDNPRRSEFVVFVEIAEDPFAFADDFNRDVVHLRIGWKARHFNHPAFEGERDSAIHRLAVIRHEGKIDVVSGRIFAHGNRF